MKKIVGLATWTLACLLLSGAAWAAEGKTGSTRPPRNLKKVGDHWTAWDPPPAGPDAYIIQKGDTLWDLAQKWMGNPYLWPQIWDQNRYILDSHWIYPGDPLGVPAKPQVVPKEGPPAVEEAEEPPTPSRPARPVAEPTAARRALLPLADPRDVYCTGYIDANPTFSSLWISGREIERIGVATGDVVYLNQGRNEGLAAGMKLAVTRRTGKVWHPATREEMGWMIRRLGRLRVLAAQEATAIAVIEESCDEIVNDDEVVPWVDIPVPNVQTLPPFERYRVDPTGGPQGYVVAVRDDLDAAGTGHIVHVDLAAGAVRPGSVLSLYRESAEHPRRMIGQAVVLTVDNGSSTAKITHSIRELGVGDRVEVVR